MHSKSSHKKHKAHAKGGGHGKHEAYKGGIGRHTGKTKGGAGTAFGIGLAGGDHYKQGPKGTPCNEC